MRRTVTDGKMHAMGLQRRGTVIGVVGCVAAVLGSGTGAAAASEAVPADARQSLISVKIEQPNTALFAVQSMSCRAQGNGSHPYLVLDEDGGGRNEHRFARTVTYHTGDGARLRFLLEFAVAGNGLPIAETDYFTSAFVQVQIAGDGGHRNIEMSCAASPEAAHQK
ncbi:hypothetical protein LQL77_29805 [Rhodococcus cerastii]|nr:hypothetical protein [Rhodococcus cerastii]